MDFSWKRRKDTENKKINLRKIFSPEKKAISMY